ncbi:DUF4350 domain-containing protein [Persicimonas caeni]|uniref:DUF4350 domain-containing protein n=1 Tax=Persicimonas caeni TaxID=2292766 RepID=A0A4Y6PSI5_PERCE|nr:DUF4350 domain-containing protein [Persicimonas caeni]QDG51292.1 DUF4350 domain-containing protein [Persicimonas caeni]QED32513.1 DUF4350 domain-containing protein [Persicimonas caeni]
MSDGSRKKTALLALVVVGILALLGLGGAAVSDTLFEEVEEEVREPPSGEARRNHFLALERLLSRFDHDVTTVRRLGEPSPVATTIILADPSDEFSPEQVDAWENWVVDGGHLILTQPVEDADEKTAPLLARLGFDVANEGDEWPYEVEVSPLEIDYLDDSTPSLRWVASDADWLLFSGPDEPFAASRKVSDYGRVTLLSSAEIFDNNTIGKGEHATLAMRILELPEATDSGYETVTIVMFGARDSWMFYVASHIWPFLLLVVVGLLLAIQNGRKRFGPMLADPPEERRSRREHVDAVGRFLWEQGATAALVEAAQGALMAELETRRPRVASAPNAERHEIVAEELGITPSEARELFRQPSGNRNAETFTQKIRQLEHHRRKL